MNAKQVRLLYLITGALLFGACRQPVKVKSNTDTFMSGTASFLIDESCAPIVDEEAFIFKSLFPQAKPHLVYRSENEALNLLLKDSIPFAILARDLTPAEKRVMDEHTLPADVNKFAVDAITLIVNKASNDTNITVSQVKAMLNGRAMTNRNVVFDNPNSSLVRYLKELAGTKDLNAKNVYALKSNKDVIRYVSSHTQAIGITGFAWLNDPDKDYAAAVNDVKIMGVKNDAKNDASFTKPSQETLSLKQYPLIRSLYIINCTGRQGLGAGFAGFLLSDRGQRIILKSGLLPEIMPGREINFIKQ